MNNKALMHYISGELLTYVRTFDENNRLTGEFCGREDLKQLPSLSEEFYTLLLEKQAQAHQNCPCIVLVNQLVLYTVIAIPQGYFLVGPCRFSFQIALIHQVATTLFPSDLSSQMSVISVPEYSAYVKSVILIHNLYNAHFITEEMLWSANLPDEHHSIQKEFQNTIFQDAEEGKKHNPYEQELREQASIEQGDVAALETSLAEQYSGSLGTLSHNPLRNVKNIGIVVITLASRSAIRGGLLPEVAFSLFDSYIQQLEEKQDIPSVQQLTRKAEYQYTEMVHEILEKKKGSSPKKNPYITRCKNYIFSHLHDKITVKEIAQSLNINANYLSELFKSHEGISLSRYILEEKINRAKNLLAYSQYSYIEIATYLGFSSQSHFIRQFKNITGYTPKDYRNEFGGKEF
jgi:AraC-like DNA-binding protein